jgi:hypothetical protein
MSHTRAGQQAMSGPNRRTRPAAGLTAAGIAGSLPAPPSSAGGTAGSWEVRYYPQIAHKQHNFIAIGHTGV